MRGILAMCWVLLLASAPAAVAGPWARAPGDVFLSFTLSSSTDRTQLVTGAIDANNFFSAYGEVGLGRRLTLGFDIGGDDANDLQVLFLRRTFTQQDQAFQIAADLGVGRRYSSFDGDSEVYRVGFSIGRGYGPQPVDWLPFFEPSGGWFALDASYSYIAETGGAISQAEATLGVNLSEEFAGLLQFKVEEYPGSDVAVTLTPSALYRIRGGPTALQVGARFGLSGSEEVGLRIGLWREF